MKRYYLFLPLFFVFLSSPVLAEDYLVSITKKQEDKYSNRWTLADWFEDQRKIRLQDMWLAGNTREDNYEFYIGSSNFSGTFTHSSTGESAENLATGSLAAYATIAGLEVDYFDRNQTASVGYMGQFKLRILGTSMQNTSLFVGYGQKSFILSGTEFTNDLYSVQLSLYFTKKFGIMGQQIVVNPQTSNGIEYSEVENKVQIFLDFGLLRLFASSIQGKQTLKSPAEATVDISGIESGFKLFL